MLCSGNDLGSGLLILIICSLPAGQVCFGTLEWLDFLGRGCISLGEYIDGVHTYFQVITDIFLLKLELGVLDAS